MGPPDDIWRMQSGSCRLLRPLLYSLLVLGDEAGKVRYIVRINVLAWLRASNSAFFTFLALGPAERDIQSVVVEPTRRVYLVSSWQDRKSKSERASWILHASSPVYLYITNLTHPGRPASYICIRRLVLGSTLPGFLRSFQRTPHYLESMTPTVTHKSDYPSDYSSSLSLLSQSSPLRYDYPKKMDRQTCLVSRSQSRQNTNHVACSAY